MSLEQKLRALSPRLAKEFNRTKDAGGINRRLAPFHLALAGQKNQFCNAVVIGDSVSEGAVTSNPLDGRWQGVFAKALRDEPGGEGYLPAWFASPFVTNPATFSHTPVNVVGATGNPPVQFDEVATSVGPASRRIGLQKNGWVEWTFTGDQVRVWYDTTDFFALNGKVFIDGVESATLTGQGSPSEPMLFWNSPVLSRGKHTIRIQEAGGLGGAFWVEAVQFLDGDLLKGVHVYDAAHSGATASYFMNSNNPWPSAIPKVLPSLVIIMLGFNDCTEVTPAQFLTNLRAVVARIRAKLTDGTYTLAVVAPWAPKPEPAAGWDAYVASMETLANEHPNGVLVRVGDRWPVMQAGQGNPGMFANDTVHPAESGQRLLGLYLADALGLPGRVNQASSMPRKLETTFIDGPGPNWFVTSGWYAIPQGAVAIDIEMVAPGHGGGAGRRGAAASVRCGGGGGGAGASFTGTVNVSELPAGTTRLWYTLPPPGAGAPATTTNDTNGAAGGSANGLTYVSLVEGNWQTKAVAFCNSHSAGGGRGGTNTNGAGGNGAVSTFTAPGGAAANTTGGVGGNGGSTLYGATGGAGGAGGGLTTANVAANGGAGGYSTALANITLGGGAGVAAGTRTGGSGNATLGPYPTANGGGGGGAAHASLAAGDGGRGGDYGGGGGGGGASVNGQVSGAGGDGGRGYIRFTARF